MGVFSSGALAGLAKVGMVVVSVGGLTAGAVFAYQTTQGDGGSGGQTATVSPTPAATETSALSPTADPATAEPTDAPTATIEPTAPPSEPTEPRPTIDAACAKRSHSHLNIEMLAAQPEMAEATITEIDDDQIRVVFEGVEAIVQGFGEVVGILDEDNLSREQFSRLVRAVDAVRYAC